jgi:hypothetical protein
MLSLGHGPKPQFKCLPVSPKVYASPRSHMTIAAGMLCNDGVIFGADTDETVGEMRRRVHKIPTKMTEPRALITGACNNGHLMDTAIERIFDGLTKENSQTSESVAAFLYEVMLGLYEREFKAYPDQTSTGMRLLFALKPEMENKAVAWSIDCTSVHRMKHIEIVGCGDYAQYVADHLAVPGLALESGMLAMVQIIAAAKKRVLYVGGETFVHVLKDDGAVGMQNYRFSPEAEDLYEYFFTLGSGLLLATGNKTISDAEFEKLGANFIKNLSWKRKQILGG